MTVEKNQKMSTRTITNIAVLATLATGLMFIELAIPIFPGFLKLDISELPVLIGTFAMGPIAGILIELVKNILHFIIGTTSGGIGEVANFIVGSAILIPAGIIYNTRKSKSGALIGLVVGSVVMVIVAAIANWLFIIPAYVAVLHFPLDAIIGMGTAANPAIKNLFSLVLYGIVPFNIIKTVVISILTLLVYKRVSPFLHGKHR
jgi:riboflavin transporter FmnP